MGILSKSISEDNVLIKSCHYPILHKNSFSAKHNVLLGIGGNVGHVVRRFEYLYYFLVKSPFITIIETSPILKNPPFGYLKQRDFYNAVIHMQTNLTARKLLDYTMRIERRFGRKRSFQDAPRTLDIDMIFFDDRDIKTERLTVPHPHWQDRESVLIPLDSMKGVAWLKRHL